MYLGEKMIRRNAGHDHKPLNKGRLLSGPHVSLITLLTLTMLSLGCTSNKSGRANQNLRFSTLITQQEVKRFELNYHQQKHLRIHSLDRQQRNQDAVSRKQKKLKRFLENSVRQIIKETAYCRNGYILLGRFAGKNTHRVRGECRDSASLADYKNFPNTISHW